jgi:hypothetical protein
MGLGSQRGSITRNFEFDTNHNKGLIVLARFGKKRFLG